MTSRRRRKRAATVSLISLIAVLAAACSSCYVISDAIWPPSASDWYLYSCPLVRQNDLFIDLANSRMIPRKFLMRAVSINVLSAVDDRGRELRLAGICIKPEIRGWTITARFQGLSVDSAEAHVEFICGIQYLIEDNAGSYNMRVELHCARSNKARRLGEEWCPIPGSPPVCSDWEPPRRSTSHPTTQPATQPAPK